MDGDPGVNASTSARRLPARARPALAVAAALAPCALLAWTACGGTTGREDEVPPATDLDGGADATLLAMDPVDASVAYDTGAFDVAILYADRALPDVSVLPEAGQEGGGTGFPDCPPWLAVDSAGNIVPLGDPAQASFIPSDYGEDGGAVPAADGGVCATYPWYAATFKSGWLQRWALDNAGSDGFYTFMPPCNWAVDSGTAQAGTAAGASRFDLCMSLYACIEASHCTQGPNGPLSCLCGDGDGAVACRKGGVDPEGPCAAQEIAGFEVPASGTILANVINHFAANEYPPPLPVYIDISSLNAVYSTAGSDRFLVPLDAGAE